MKKVELVFIPSPGLSHLVSTVEAANLLLHRHHRLTVTVLIMKQPNNSSVDRYTQQTSANPTTSPRLNLLHLPALDDGAQPSISLPHLLVDRYKNHVREAISNLIQRSESDQSQLGGLVLDMFCAEFIEIGGEFGLHSYIFFTSGAASLALSQHMVAMRFEENQELNYYKQNDVDLSVPYFKSPVPSKALPSVSRALGAAADGFLSLFQTIRKAKGIMVNSFYELDSYAVDSLNSDDKTPTVYPVGPILNQGQMSDYDDEVKKWLDEQPENSVVYLCFGTMGSFDEAQVREISLALENSRCRFLWSLRKAAAEELSLVTTEYEDFNEVLPEGFLERTKGVGKVIGWAAQVAVLSHVAVGGFVSHCGWNSALESLWFGVPIAGFPMYAEQHLNAFYLATEVGAAEMISLDYAVEFRGVVVGWEKIVAAIRRLMAEGSGVREKVKEMKEKARAALEEGGSSYNFQNLFIEDVIRNMS